MKRTQAINMIDFYIGSITGGLTANDLGDSVTYMNALDTIENLLNDNDPGEAKDSARYAAVEMLTEEGFLPL